MDMQSPNVVHDDALGVPLVRPRCIANTRRSFCDDVDHHSGVRHDQDGQPNFFKEAQFSADGTTIVSHNRDESLRAFVLPQDLLVPSDRPHELVPYSTLPSATNVQSYAIYPGFDLADPSATLILSAPSNLPLRLTNALDATHVPATYPYINSSNEAFIAPNSLAFIHGGTHFVAGSAGRISVFDIARSSGPEMYHDLKAKSNATRMRDTGRIMALSVSSDGLLAAGSTNRSVTIFGDSGHGECHTSFSIAGGAGDEPSMRGSGVTSLAWTPDGKCLLVAERQSDKIQVYDVRNLLRRVALLSGRDAGTTQRMGIDCVAAQNGCELWAGGVNGMVRMWKDPGSVEGEHAPDVQIKMHDDAVSSAVWHPSGAVLATCSGQRKCRSRSPEEDATSSDSASESSSSNKNARHMESECTLKVWDFAPKALTAGTVRAADHQHDAVIA